MFSYFPVTVTHTSTGKTRRQQESDSGTTFIPFFTFVFDYILPAESKTMKKGEKRTWLGLVRVRH